MIWVWTVGMLLSPAGPAGFAPVEQQEPLTPTWSRQVRSGVEWVEPVGEGGTAALLVAARDGRLHLLDLATGRPRWAEPLVAGRGVQLAAGGTGAGRPSASPSSQSTTPASASAPVTTAPRDVAYCFDRHAIYAIHITEPAGLKWQHGERPGVNQGFPGDPEVLTGWFAAEATPVGLLAANTDGRVILLSPADGAVRRQIDLGRLPVARLHGCGSTAAIVWKAGADVTAAFVNLQDPQPKPTVRPLSGTWPLWSTLAAEGLLTVSPVEVALWPMEGPPRRFSIDAYEMRSSGVDVCRLSAGATTRATTAPVPAVVLLIGDGPHPCAYDLATGQKLWPLSDIHEPGSDIETLAVQGERFVVTSRAGAIVGEAATGRTLAACLQAPPWEFVASGLVDRRLYGLFHVPEQPGAPLCLVRVQVTEAAASRPTTVKLLAETFHLTPAGTVRQVVWAGGRMVLSEADGLRAIELP